MSKRAPNPQRAITVAEQSRGLVAGLVQRDVVALDVGYAIGRFGALTATGAATAGALGFEGLRHLALRQADDGASIDAGIQAGLHLYQGAGFSGAGDNPEILAGIQAARAARTADGVARALRMED